MFISVSWMCIVFGTICLLFGEVLGGTKCFKNDDLGDHPGNVYFCTESDKPDCCEENEEFKCCESKVDKTLREQAILFGSLFAAILLIVIVFVCIMKDVRCCSSDMTLKEKCASCCCKNYVKPPEDEEEYMPKEEYKTKYRPFHHNGNIHTNYEDLKIRPESTCSTLAGGSWYKYY